MILFHACRISSSDVSMLKKILNWSKKSFSPVCPFSKSQRILWKLFELKVSGTVAPNLQNVSIVPLKSKSTKTPPKSKKNCFTGIITELIFETATS